jgi:peptidyl-prolyl cis-trans isomerase SurA
MKPFHAPLAGLATFLALAHPTLAQAPPSAPASPIEVNGIAAKVNGKVITKNKVAFMLAPVYAQLATQFPRRGQQFEAKFKEARANILQELIDRQIILDEFRQMGASIPDHVIEEEVKRQMRDLYNGDEEKFRAELRRSRLTMEGFREMTREKMTVQAMRARKFTDVPPPLPDEVAKEYAEAKLSLRDATKDVLDFRKIFIPARDPANPVSPPEMQLALAEGLAGRIAKGEDFATLAKAHSQDAFATEGGLQKNVPRTDLSPEFASILSEATPGKLIGPLTDPQGFTIVQLISIKHGPTPPLTDPKVREMIEERVRRRKTSAEYDRWIQSRRKRAMIELRS